MEHIKLQNFTDEIKKHCKDYGIKFLDLLNEYNCLTDLADGIHPRDKMYTQLGKAIGNVLRCSRKIGAALYKSKNHTGADAESKRLHYKKI